MVLWFLVALLFAFPTGGLSLIAWIAYVFFRQYLVAKTRVRMGNEYAARRAIDAGQRRVPSWAAHANERKIFVEVIQQVAMSQGVPQSYLSDILSDGKTFEYLVYYAGALEQQGASFIEQKASVADQLVERWENYCGNIKPKSRSYRFGS